jgi:ABC-type nitrate/sulfonate/bicarbonate transport system substrate-binding protein
MNDFFSDGSRRSIHWFFAAIALYSAFASIADAATRDLEKVRIGYSVGGLIPFPLIVAKENRFFEQAGFDVEMINIPPTIAVTALISGDIQYVIFAGTTLNAAVRGLPVKLVMVYNDRPLFSLMSRPEIRSIKELKGKVLGVATLTSGESFLSRRLLKDAGIDADKEMTLRVIGNTPFSSAARRRGGRDDADDAGRYPRRTDGVATACVHGRQPGEHQRRLWRFRPLAAAAARSNQKDDRRGVSRHGLCSRAAP